MSPENGKKLPGNEESGLNFDTELTLGLPGKSRVTSEGGAKLGSKRGFSETVVDLKLGEKSTCADQSEEKKNNIVIVEEAAIQPPLSKAQVVGWPPVGPYRKNAMKKCKYVKVAVDGAPYLRKVDLEMYNTYHHLLTSLQHMFSCFTISRNYLNDEKKIVDQVNGIEYVPTYQDKDGDWMLVGDVPWQMFVESCKRLRLMKSSEATGLAPRSRAPPI